MNESIVDVITKAKLVSSKSDGRRLIELLYLTNYFVISILNINSMKYNLTKEVDEI